MGSTQINWGRGAAWHSGFNLGGWGAVQRSQSGPMGRGQAELWAELWVGRIQVGGDVPLDPRLDLPHTCFSLPCQPRLNLLHCSLSSTTAPCTMSLPTPNLVHPRFPLATWAPAVPSSPVGPSTIPVEQAGKRNLAPPLSGPEISGSGQADRFPFPACFPGQHQHCR